MLALTGGRAEEGRFVVLAGDAGGGQIFPQPAIQIVADRDLAHLAAFFAEADRPLFAEIPQIPEAQLGDGANARAGGGKDAKHGAIAQAHDVSHVNRAQEFARVLDTDLGRGTLGDAVLDATHGGEGIEHDRMARHEAVEEMAQRGKSLVLRRRGTLELAHIVASQARRDVAELDAFMLAPARGQGAATAAEDRRAML